MKGIIIFGTILFCANMVCGDFLLASIVDDLKKAGSYAKSPKTRQGDINIEVDADAANTRQSDVDLSLGKTRQGTLEDVKMRQDTEVSVGEARQGVLIKTREQDLGLAQKRDFDLEGVPDPAMKRQDVNVKIGRTRQTPLETADKLRQTVSGFDDAAKGTITVSVGQK